MPYVRPEVRQSLDKGTPPRTAGELNYVITRAIQDYLGVSLPVSLQPNYSDYNEAIGVLECAKLELYRRLIAVYENKKIADNGDVY